MRTLKLTVMALLMGVSPILLAAQTDAHLQVQAEASIETAPDKATLTAALWEKTPVFETTASDSDRQGDALEQARDKLETRTSALLKALADAGIAKGDIHAGSLSIQPETIDDGSEDSSRTQRTRIRIERPLNVTLDDISRVAPVIDALMAAGVNRLDGISYDVANRDSVEDSALRQAIERARRKAEVMAQTLDVKLGPVIDVQETRAPIFRPMMMSVASSARAKSADYQPGNLSVEAGVAVSWQIAH